MTRFWRPVAILFFFLAVTVTTETASARSLEEAARLITGNVERYLVSEGAREINVQVNGPRQVSKQLVEAKLQELFTALKIDVNANAEWTLDVKIKIANAGSDVPTTNLRVEVLDKDGNTKDNFDEFFDEENVVQGSGEKVSAPSSVNAEKKPDSNNNGAVDVSVNEAPEIPQVQGQNIDFSSVTEKVAGTSPGAIVPTADKSPDPQKLRKQQADLKAAVKEKILTVSKKPEFVVTSAPSPNSVPGPLKSILRPATDSRFGMEIVKGKSPDETFTPVLVEDRNSQPFVSLEEGDYIKINIYNNNPFPVGLELMIDGVNSLILSENPTFRKNGRWLIDANSKGTIAGWMTRPNVMQQFVITSEPNGVAARFGVNHKIGTIQANFYMAWDEQQHNSGMAPLFAVLCNSSGFKNGDNAVGAGPDIEFAGTIRSAVFDRGFALATITLLHENPQSNLPPGLPPGAGAGAD